MLGRVRVVVKCGPGLETWMTVQDARELWRELGQGDEP
jgi:hypothetical protein